LDSRERVIRTLRREHPDRAPVRDAPWEDTIARWHAEGLPQDVPLDDYFEFDFDSMSVDASPRFEQRLLSEDDEFQIYTDRFGYTVKRAKGRGGTMDFMDHVTKDRVVWETQVKDRFVLDPEDSARIDDASYFKHMDAYPTWAEAKQKFDAMRQRGRYLLFDG
jgi:uroporphyrinogen decarboxylase